MIGALFLTTELLTSILVRIFDPRLRLQDEVSSSGGPG